MRIRHMGDFCFAGLLDWFNALGVSFCFRNNLNLENQVVPAPR